MEKLLGCSGGGALNSFESCRVCVRVCGRERRKRNRRECGTYHIDYRDYNKTGRVRMFPHVTMETKGGLRGNEVMIITHLRTLRNLSSPSPRSPCGVVVLHTCFDMASFTDLTITCECTESPTPFTQTRAPLLALTN